MIIVEGADNSGKTTFAKKLAFMLSEESLIPYISSGGPPKTNLQMVQNLSLQLLSAKEAQVRDRVTCISDPIYSGKMNESLYHYFQNAFVELKVPVIYCRPPDEVLLDIANHPVKDHETIEHVKWVIENQPMLIKRYDQLMRGIPHITYDWTRDDFSLIADKIRGNM